MRKNMAGEAANFDRVISAVMRKAQSGEMDTFIFDFDGVLADSRRANVSTVLETVQMYGFKAKFVNGSLGALCSRHSPDVILRMLVPELEQRPLVLALMVGEMKAIAIRNVGLILPSPMVEILSVLKGRYGAKLGVATNRKECAAPAIRHVGAEKYLDTIVTSLDAPEKPDKAMIEIAMRRMGAGPRSTLFIGDNKEDLLAGRGAGVKVKLVQWGRR